MTDDTTAVALTDAEWAKVIAGLWTLKETLLASHIRTSLYEAWDREEGQ